MDISGTTFIVTGGGSGLGRATAECLVNAGGRVVLADTNEAVGEAAASDLGDGAAFVQTDVCNEDAVLAAVKVAVEKFGNLRGAINCAGVASAMKTVSKLGPHPLDLFSKVVEINLIGTFNVVRLVAAAIQDAEPTPSGDRGVFINTASVAAFEGQVGQAAYAASKAGVVGLTLCLARDLSRLAMRCVTIAPGIFDTPMLAGLPEEVRESLGGQVPFPSRLGRPEEFGALVRHIIENSMLNGETIRLDGAIRMQPK